MESVRQRVVNLAEYKDVSPVLDSAETLEDHLMSWFTDGRIELTAEQVAEIEEMEKEYQIY